MKLILILLCLIFGPSSVHAEGDASNIGNRFFLHGDGHVKLKNIHNGRAADIQYLTPDGFLRDEAFFQVDTIFGFPTRIMGENVSRRTVAFLDYFTDKIGKDGEVIQLVCGYRSQDYNNALRRAGKTAAKTSTHIDGMALDFQIQGVNGSDFWELIRAQNCCGVGNYGGNVVHLDSGRPRFWTTATSKVHTRESDFNRMMWVSTEYDRYQLGEELRFFFTSVSDFSFGVNPEIIFVPESAKKGKEKAAKLVIEKSGSGALDKDKGVLITERRHARFLFVKVPEKIKPGFYRLKIRFQHRPFAEMPEEKLSNLIEIIKK